MPLESACDDTCEFEGYQVLVASDGEAGIQQALHGKPDIILLILLDIMLPKLSGLDVCRRLRKQGIKTPIIMLTARGQEMDKVIGLETGADEYMTKPFGVNELLARVRAHLRRSTNFDSLERYSFCDVELDFKSYKATKAGKVLELSPVEFETLRYLIVDEGRLSRGISYWEKSGAQQFSLDADR